MKRDCSATCNGDIGSSPNVGSIDPIKNPLDREIIFIRIQPSGVCPESTNRYVMSAKVGRSFAR
jgi:hypothetical protein